MKQRSAFTLMEVLVATMIFSFVALSMSSVYYAANKNVLQNIRSDKFKSDVSTSMHAISVVMAQATRIQSPAVDGESDDLVVMTNVESSSTNPCCPMVPTSYGNATDLTPRWYRFCVDTSNRLWYYTNTLGTCNGCPNTTGYSFTVNGSYTSTCGSTGNNRMLLATSLNRTVKLFSRKRQPTPHNSTSGMAKRASNTAHTRIIDNKNTINVFIRTVWNGNATQTPVDYTLESFFTVMQPR